MLFLTNRQMLEITDEQLKQILSLKIMEGALDISKETGAEEGWSEQEIINNACSMAESHAPDHFEDIMPDIESCKLAVERLKFITP